jgi:hypothetical protein
MEHVGRKPLPQNSFLHRKIRVGFKNGEHRWRDEKGKRLYTWDSLHGHVEVFTATGRHIASVDAVTEALIGEAVEGRRIDVS